MRPKNELLEHWYTYKAVLKGKFIAMQAFIRKQQRTQINNLTCSKRPITLNPQVSRLKKIRMLRIGAQKIVELKVTFFVRG